MTFPGRRWTFRTPAQVGLREDKLNELIRNIGGHGCIVRDGYMVKYWGKTSAHQDWASAAKPVKNTLLFFAIKGQALGVDALANPLTVWRASACMRCSLRTVRYSVRAKDTA